MTKKELKIQVLSLSISFIDEMLANLNLFVNIENYVKITMPENSNGYAGAISETNLNKYLYLKEQREIKEKQLIKLILETL